jgi:hypothetical protein
MATLKFKIDNEAVLDAFFDDTRVLGIVAPIPDYRLCWLLNHSLGFDFRINNDLEVKLIKKGREYFFPIYESFEKSGTIRHYLYNNHCEGEYLLPEFKHLDFLWLMKDDVISSNDLNGLISSIKTIPPVQLITEMDIEKIKNRQHLIF